jgi:hypothetical protein
MPALVVPTLPVTAVEAVTEARARLHAARCILDVLVPTSGARTPSTDPDEREELYRSALVALAGVTAGVEDARRLETAARLACGVPTADLTPLGAVS